MQDRHSSDNGQPMNLTAVKLLQAAAEFVGGEKQLAVRLDIAPSLLGKLMAGHYDVPKPLVFRAVEILLAHRDLSSLNWDSSQ
jgi:hypothetical protein